MKSHTILIASQRAHFRDELRNILISDGHSVQIAMDGLEAVDIIRYGCFDVIVTDLMLPRMDGIELVANAKDFQQRARIVVFAPACPGDREAMLQKMGVQRIGHPETPEQAKEWIEQVLNEASYGRPSPWRSRKHKDLRSS